MKKSLLLLLFISLLYAFTTVSAQFVPQSGAYYNIIHKNSGLAVGPNLSDGVPTIQAAIMPVVNDAYQAFQFIAVTGKSSTYYIANAKGLYLNKSTANNWDTKFESAINGTYSEWIVVGKDSETLRLQNNINVGLNPIKCDLGPNANTSSSLLYTDKSARIYYKLVKASTTNKPESVPAQFVPQTDVYYNIIHIKSGLAVGANLLDGVPTTQSSIMTVADDANQAFKFIPVTGKANIYYIVNAKSLYLNKSTANNWDVKFESAKNGVYSEWAIVGTDRLNLRLQNNINIGLNPLKCDLGTNANTSGSVLYADKSTRVYYKLNKTVLHK